MSIQTVKAVNILALAERLGIEVNASGKAYCIRGHDKKTPSLSFNKQGNYFYCFGCGIGGSTIDLVKEVLSVPTKEAIRWIEREFLHAERPYRAAQRPGGCPDTTPGGKTHCRPSTSELRAKKPTSTDGKQYTELYRRFIDSLDSKEAIWYLKSRGIQETTTTRAQIRAVPKPVSEVVKRLTHEYGRELLRASGILKGEWFAFARNRLVIPFFDSEGNVLALQGRNIDDNEEPRYRLLAGVKTPLYNRHALAGLREGETVYLCEGVLDCLSAMELGLRTPVAVVGVSNFQAEYFDLLEPYKLIVASDRDGAGRAFYIRIEREYLKRGKRIYSLDYDRLKADLGIPADNQAKDLNDILKQAKRKPLFYSAVLNKRYWETETGILFEDGVCYTDKEMGKIEGLRGETVKALHTAKAILQGEIV